MKLPKKDFEALTPVDFDGHTEFNKLTLEQRLQWLSEMAQFLYWAKQAQTSGTAGPDSDAPPTSLTAPVRPGSDGP